MPFRKALVWIRSQYINREKDLFLYSAIATAVMFGLTLLADFLLTWDQWAVFVRAILAIPASISIFVLGYGLAMKYSEHRQRKNPEYKDWRMKLSPLMRQRVSIVIGAVLFVCMFAVVQRPGYTFVSSVIIAVIIGLFVFMRKTIQEINRSRIGLPDSRDAAFDSHLRQQAKIQAEKRANRKKNRKKKFSKEAQAQIEADEAKILELERKLEERG